MIGCVKIGCVIIGCDHSNNELSIVRNSNVSVIRMFANRIPHCIRFFFQVKRAALHEMVEYVTTNRNVLTESTYPEVNIPFSTHFQTSANNSTPPCYSKNI